MYFLYPLLSIAFIALLIPVIVHLFNFRKYKTVFFSNTAFLRTIQEETNKQSKLKHLLVLACRCLALLFLILAFIQPIIGKRTSNTDTDAKALSIFIDNSYSMNAQGSERSLLESAKASAKDIITSHSKNTQFQIITNEMNGAQQHLMSYDDAIEYIDKIKPSPYSKTFAKIIHNQMQVLKNINTDKKNIYLLSDFQKSQMNMINDSNYIYHLIPIQNPNKQNVFIDTCWFDNPAQILHQTNQLYVKITNSGENDYDNIRLTLEINGTVKTIKDIALDAGKSIVDTLSFKLNTTGWEKAKVSINDFPITFDDSYYIGYKVNDKIKTLVINDGSVNKYVDAIFKNEAFDCTHSTINSLKYTDFPTYHLIVVNGVSNFSSGFITEMRKYVDQKGNVVVMPGSSPNMGSYNEFCNGLNIDKFTSEIKQKQSIATINHLESVFKNVFDKLPENAEMPSALSHWGIDNSSRNMKENILSFQDRSPMLVKYTNDKNGKIYLFTAALDAGNTSLMTHSIFAPMMYKIALLSASSDIHAYSMQPTMNITFTKEDNSKEIAYKIKSKNIEYQPTQQVFGNEVQLSLNDLIKEDGFYDVIDDKNTTAAVLGLNFNRAESLLDYYSASDLSSLYKGDNVHIISTATEGIGKAVQEINSGFVLWKWCLFLCLLFLLGEILLMRYFKR